MLSDNFKEKGKKELENDKFESFETFGGKFVRKNIGGITSLTNDIYQENTIMYSKPMN